MARKKPPDERFYWDSCAFLAYLLPEPGRVDDCSEALESAADGECIIVTSVLTLTEVVRLKGHPPLKQDQEDTIRRFFENDYIVLRQVDRFVAEDARKLVWAKGVKPKDSIHLATALRWNIPELHTYDEKLLKLDGSLGNPGLRITTPAARQRRIVEATDEPGGGSSEPSSQGASKTEIDPRPQPESERSKE